MKKKINLISFILSLICLALFFISISSSDIVNFTMGIFKIHPLVIVLLFSIVTLILGFIGLSSVSNYKIFLRSILSIISNIILLGVIAYILILGNLFQFT